MPNLIPTFPVAPLPEQPMRRTGPSYGLSWAWDWENGDFAVDGAGRVQKVDGHQSWVDWCIKTIHTDRFAYLVYGPDYGTELVQALRQPSREAVEAQLTRAITEALMVDPRTQAVRDFSFIWRGDELHVSCTVVPVVGDPARLEVTYRG